VSPIDSYIFLHNLDGAIIENALEIAANCAGCDLKTPGCRPAAFGIAQQAASSVWEQMQAQSIDTLDALGFAAKRLSEVNGTRILVLTSPGFLLRPGVQPELAKFIDGALRWNIVVHAIGAQGLDATPETSSHDFLRRSLFGEPLEHITDGTGGHYFKDNNDLAGQMKLAANPEVSYLLAFDPGGRDGRFHTLKIRFTSKRPDSLQFRPGYFSPADPKKELSARAPLDDAVFSKQALHDVPAVVALGAGQPKDGTLPLSIVVTVDLNGLKFVASKGRHVQQLVFLTALLDLKGGFVTGKESIMDLVLTDERLAVLEKEGLRAVATLNAPAGNYQVRTIVREAIKGRLTASTTLVALGKK
jgi:hypothetical protein